MKNWTDTLGPMRVILRIATGFPGEGSTRDHTKGEYRNVVGTGDSYEAAKADAESQLPEGALVLSVIANRD